MLKTPFQEIRATVGTGSLTSKALKAALGLAICALALCASRTAQAQSETWNNTAGKNWVSTGNWSNSTVPGTTGVAEFDADPTDSGSSNGLGIAFTSGTVNNGSFSGASGSLPDQGVGAISVTSLHAQSSIFFGSTGTGGGYMTFSGATVGGIANTILSNMSSGNLHIQNQVNGGSGSFGVVLGATNNIIQTAAGLSSTTNGVSVEILSTINEATAGSSITLYGGGASGTTGGVLELAGTNSFTGGITIGLSDGSGNQAGTVQIDASYALPTTGAILVNANSDLLLNTSGTYGGVGQSLTLNGAGTVANSGALQTGGGGQSVTWQGNLTLGSNRYPYH
jgi:hypothetical protein